MASFNVSTADIQDDELALEETKLRTKIKKIEETLPGLKAQLKEIERRRSSLSLSSSPGESKTEATAPALTKDESEDQNFPEPPEMLVLNQDAVDMDAEFLSVGDELGEGLDGMDWLSDALGSVDTTSDSS